MADFIASISDAELVTLAELFFNGLNPAPTTYGATAAQATDLDTKRNAYVADLNAHVAA